MLISPSGGWRNLTSQWIVWWLSDRLEQGFITGYAIWWVISATLDGLHQLALEGVYASWPGFGTPTALSLIGQSRGMIRGMGENDAHFAQRMIPWLSLWQHAGSEENIIQGIWAYVLGQPPCFVVNRNGTRVSIATDGTMTTDVITWDWDSLSNPYRSDGSRGYTYWSELWIVVYNPPWAYSATTFPFWNWGQGDTGLGHLVERVDADAIRGNS